MLYRIFKVPINSTSIFLFWDLSYNTDLKSILLSETTSQSDFMLDLPEQIWYQSYFFLTNLDNCLLAIYLFFLVNCIQPIDNLWTPMVFSQELKTVHLIYIYKYFPTLYLHSYVDTIQRHYLYFPDVLQIPHVFLSGLKQFCLSIKTRDSVVLKLENV